MDGITNTRESVLDRARSGDTTDLVRIYAPFVANLARKWGRARGLSEADAEDVAQEAMLQLLRLVVDFRYDRQKGRFKGLVSSIVTRRVADASRRRKPTDMDLGQISVEEDREFEDLQEREWVKAQLLMVLDIVRKEVQPSTFQCFQLTWLDGLSNADVARRLGLPPNTVAQNKRRVFERVRSQFADLDIEI